MAAELTLTQLAIIVGTISGVVFGLIPLVLGFIKKNKKLGIIGFVLCIIVGPFLSLLGVLPVCIVFIWLILRKPAETAPVEVKAVNENPIDASVKDSENPAADQTPNA